MRWLLLIHRYLGIAIGVLMFMWCISGAVMMYVRYPQLSQAERARHLPPIDWSGCCTVGDALSDAARAGPFQIEMVAGRPVLRLRAGRRSSLIDLTSGQAMPKFSSPDALAIASSFARADGISSKPQLLGVIDHDQWTVAGEFNAARPLFLFALGDANDTQLYVSSVTGQVVQRTTAHERFWNWLGTVPHWLYFTELRRNARLWTQIVIWTSLTGCFLTLTGLYIGVQRWLKAPRGRWSPYRGILLWHHLPGVIFGLFLLSWVASGLISMNPWGFLDSEGSSEAMLLLRGPPLSGAAVKQVVRTLPALAAHPGIVAISAAPLFGRPYLVAASQDGSRSRFDETGAAAAVDDSAWLKIAQALSEHGSAKPELLAHGDEYMFGRPGDAGEPVYRIIGDDPEHTRYYFDPQSASLIASFDSNARGYRWLFQGFHTLDFFAALRGRPQWDILMLTLLAGAATLSATGTYLAGRHLMKTRPQRSRSPPQLAKRSPATSSSGSR